MEFSLRQSGSLTRCRLWLSGPGCKSCAWRGGLGTMQPILQSGLGANSLTWLMEFGIRLHGWIISASLRFAPSLMLFLSRTLYTLRVSEDPVFKVNYIEHSLTVVPIETLHWNSGRHFRDLRLGAGFGKTKNILMKRYFFKKRSENTRSRPLSANIADCLAIPWCSVPWVPEAFSRVRRGPSFRRLQAETCSAEGRIHEWFARVTF